MKSFLISVVLTSCMLIIVAVSFFLPDVILTPKEIDIITVHQLPFLPENYTYENENAYYPGSFVLEKPIRAYQQQGGKGPHYLFLEADFEKEIFHFYDFSQKNPVIHASFPIETPKVRILNLITVGNYRAESSEISTDGQLTVKRHFLPESGPILISLIFGLIGAFVFRYLVLTRLSILGGNKK